MATESNRAARAIHGRGVAGFTLVEIATVLALAGLMLSMTIGGLSGYRHKIAAHHAAQLFGRDLTLARAYAVRGRESVVIRFSEANRLYSIWTMTTGREVIVRRFGVDADLDLSAITLEVPGDSVFFNSRGVLSSMGGQLGTATFSSESVTYVVSFNALGASRVERR